MKKLILFLFISNFAFAQTAVLDTNSILIGEQINFSISNTISKTEVWPTYEELLVEGVEIIKEGKLDTTENLISQNFIITAWDSGSYYIPPISFSANSKTEGLLLTVQTIILEEGAELKDIKQPMEAPMGWSDIWPFLLGFLILTLIIYLLKKYVFGEKQNNIKIVPKMIISADVVALKELEKLEKAKIWQSGEVKLYYVTISEIIRRYLWERYKFIALELPTNEILQNLRNKNLEKEDLITLTTILQRADLAKYAKSKPTDKENEESLRFGQDFVNNTKITQVLNSPNINYIFEKKIMISTGDIKEKKYTVLGIVGTTVSDQDSVQAKGGCFGKSKTDITVDTNSMYQKGANELLQLSLSKGGDAVVYANFEYRIAIKGSGQLAKQVNELFCYGTAVKLHS